ncbi:hypothetical protein SASPL_113626 [Salvia splendens]|uniref:Uncharacterized protein n=1 Tax=Salvia splendens TaxID=180675 RepID=A0A8X8ZZN7_SALSN|nr:hypothetical protein SASPL_113626 [Salvia splendens]
MSVYMRRLFPKSNSSFFLQSGTALKSKAVRLREDTYVIDAGVGFLHAFKGESTVKNSLLQRCFVDLVTGDSRTKQNAAARLDDMVGQTDSACGPAAAPPAEEVQEAAGVAGAAE